ncbi:hypothetical protein K9M18_06465, partial [Candidatus Woesearchaeota archaeon]|nr:hypothetical protein [Candidatus Woesearchaeota archaeon]
LTSLYKVTLKSFDDLGNFTKFINTEIRNVDDIIKHLDEFEALWRVVSPDVANWPAVKRNLIRLKQLSDSDKLKGIPEDGWVSQVLNGFPEKGGMRDIVNDMWRIANNKNPYLPQKVENRIVTTDPNTGTLLIGTKNEGGGIVYKNEEGKVVMVEKDPDIKVDDSRTNIKPDIEDVEWEDVSEGTTVEDLDGKKIKGTEENVAKIEDAIEDEGIGGGVYEEKQKYKTESELSAEQEIRMKELDVKLQNAKNREAELEIQKKMLNIKNNPEGDQKIVPDGESKKDVLIDEEEVKKSESRLRRFLKLPKKFFDKILILRPKSDESGFIRVSKMVGSSVVDPLGLLRTVRIPPIKRVEGFPGMAQKVILPQNVYWAWGARRLGGLTVNGIIWSWYFTSFKGPNPFSVFGYESDPDEYYFPKIYATYWKNLSKTPFVRVIPKAVEKWGEKQMQGINNDIKKYTGKTLEEWQDGYVEIIPLESKNYLNSLSCDELKAMRTDSDNPVLTPQSKKLIADYVAEKYNAEIDKQFANLEKNTGMWQKIIELVTGIKIETPEVALSMFEEVKTEDGTSVIEEQFNLEIIKKCGGITQEGDGTGEAEGEESTWYVEGDVLNL